MVRTCGVQDFMRDMPFMNIRNLGGKLGNEVETDLGISTAGDVWYVGTVQEAFDKFIV